MKTQTDYSQAFKAIPTKKCTSCGEVKELSEFGNNKNTKDGLQYQCRTCANAYMVSYREKNPEKIKEWRAKNRDKKNQNQNEYNAARRDADPNYRIRQNEASKLSIKVKNSKSVQAQEIRDHLEKTAKLRYGKAVKIDWPRYATQGWQIDHIFSWSKWDLTDPEELELASSLGNLQLLKREDNVKKGTRLNMSELASAEVRQYQEAKQAVEYLTGHPERLFEMTFNLDPKQLRELIARAGANHVAL